MLIQVTAAKCIGIDAVKVTVEVDVDKGIGIHLVGLADIAVKESLLRTTTAMEAVGFRIPGMKIVINLAPADLKKNGGGYDLPIAIGIIAASKQCSLPKIGNFVIMGELGLDASVRAIPGVLPYSEFASKEGYEGIILPYESAMEAVEMADCKVYGVKRLTDVIAILRNDICAEEYLIKPNDNETYNKDFSAEDDFIDFSDIIGQQSIKRGLEIAAAGSHNVIMVGSQGSGKSSLAKALRGILPPMTKEEAFICSKIYSVAGKKLPRHLRPFRSPHYSASLAAIIGGGNGENIIPGEVSLAQSGVLFIDEFTLMPRSVLESLRAPIEDRKVVISRLKSKIEFPSSFMLVAASNPCPCGYYGEGNRCTCAPGKREAHLAKLSGPIMDRMDLQLFVKSVPSNQLRNIPKGESSSSIAKRVVAARKIQEKRFENEAIFVNSEMNNQQIKKYCPLSSDCSELLADLMEKMNFSMRAYFRIVRLARTIADLDAAPNIMPNHILEASCYRNLDKMRV